MQHEPSHPLRKAAAAGRQGQTMSAEKRDEWAFQDWGKTALFLMIGVAPVIIYFLPLQPEPTDRPQIALFLAMSLGLSSAVWLLTTVAKRLMQTRSVSRNVHGPRE